MQEAHGLIRRCSGVQRSRAGSLPCGGGGAGGELIICGLARMFACFHLTSKHSAVFDREPVGLHFADDLTGAPELNLVAPGNFALNFSADNHFAGGHVRFHVPVWADRQTPICKAEPTLDLAIHEKILASGDVALNANSLADTSGGVRRDCYRRWGATSWGRNWTWRAGSHRGCGNLWHSLGLTVFFFPHPTPRLSKIRFSKPLIDCWEGTATQKREDSTGLSGCKQVCGVANLGCFLKRTPDFVVSVRLYPQPIAIVFASHFILRVLKSRHAFWKALRVTIIPSPLWNKLFPKASCCGKSG